MADDSLLCARCLKELVPGDHNFYVVNIEAFADPTPPTIREEDLNAAEIRKEIQRLIEDMRDLSEQELMDQVYRRFTIHLCESCYRQWIENPAGPPY